MKVPSYVTIRDLESGRRYEVRLEVTGPDGGRHQRRRQFRTLKVACEQWLVGKRIEPTTHAAYSAALAPVIERYGGRPVQKIVKADVEQLVVELRDGAGPHGVWARTSINPMLARWRSVWKDLQTQGVPPMRTISAGGLRTPR